MSNPTLVLLLHGYGSDEHDLISLAPHFPAEYHLVSLRAPFKCPMQGAQWFEIIWDQAGFDCVLEQAWESLSMLEGAYHFWVDKIQPSKTFVAGFSQGGIMALSSVLRSSVNVNGVAIWSGRLIPGLLPNMIHQHPPFCCQHGEFDPVIPVESGREINDWLLEQGIEVEYTEYPMGHSLCDDSIRDTLRWLSAR